MSTAEKKQTASTSEKTEDKSKKAEVKVDHDGDKVSTNSTEEDLKRNMAQTNLLDEEALEDTKDEVKSDDDTDTHKTNESNKEVKGEKRKDSKEASNKDHGKKDDKDGMTDKNEKKEDEEDEIFSITGLRGMKLPRHRDAVTVFPSGCMGIPDEKNTDGNRNRFLQPSEMQEKDSGHIESTPRKRPPSARQIHTTRNPLTGEGYDEKDFIIGTRRKEVKPIDKQNSKRIPPGGFSTPLW